MIDLDNAFLVTVAVAYVLGSIPFGLLLTRAAGLQDIRTIGSGNIGATNVLRTGRKSLALITLLLDALKGFLAVAIIKILYTSGHGMLAGLVVVLGHVFPVWLRFKGGKGVATALGVLFGVNVWLGASVCFTWLMVFYCTRISSLSSLLSISVSYIAAYLLGSDGAALLCLLLALLIVYTHRKNIQRLMNGTEHSFIGKTL